MIQNLFNASKDVFPLPEWARKIYGPFGLSEAPEDRPYTTSNFVQSLDGKISFRELAGKNSGKEVSRSEDDFWLMNFLMAHHDAMIVGGNTLREEPGSDGLGWDFSISNPDFSDYRLKVLKLGRPKPIILSGSGDLDLNFNVFNSEAVEPWIVTTQDGLSRLEPQLKSRPRIPRKIIAVGEHSPIDLREMMRVLRQDHGVRTLFCLGGAKFYGQLLEKKLIDEDFRAISAQVIGRSTIPGTERPTAYGDASFVPETAPWFEIVSVHLSLPHHYFLRLRYCGPREFKD